MKKIIISGGTGLVGKRLTTLLKEKGYEVNILCRNPKNPNEYKWNIEANFIDEKVFENAIAIIHLAGAGVADKRWTDERKQEIIDSRVKSTQLLFQYLAKEKHQIQTFISASAVGFYGDRKNELLIEASSNGTGFLAEVCQLWENEVEKIASLNIAVSKIRIGIVLSKDGGALPKLDFPIRFGIGAYIGNGKQFVPWIHIDDLCQIFIHLLKHKNIKSTYNACAPDVKTNKKMSQTIAHVLHRPFIPFPAPSFIIKTVLGEMANMLLMSNNCTADKIKNTGFVFQFPTLEKALENIYQK
ncbi:MAG TPA: TIGR01777 family oxidoreductase [Chitinophagales bacterium]|nr:TIGR01777 family oxidoreductase [Chitinophagales bacterium]